jgi:hypothetical protein
LRLPRGDDEKPYGVILIPIFFEVGEEPEEIASTGIFKNVFGVVRAMADHDERLQAEITSIGLGRGKRSDPQTRVNIDFGEERLVLDGFEKKLKAALIERVVERSVAWWDRRFVALKAFHEESGHWEADTEPLRSFVNDMRKAWRTRASRLSESKRRALDGVGFVTEREFMKLTGFTSTQRYRRDGIVTPRGYAKTRGGEADALSAFYDLEDATHEIRRNLGITLDDTEGLLPLQEFAKTAGLSSQSVMRRIDDGLLKSVGSGVSNGQLSLFFRPEQVEELRAALGITLRSTEGLMPETKFAKFCGRSASVIRKYREEGRIRPEGTAPSASEMAMHFYDPLQREQLLESFGINLDGIDGLLGEYQVSKEVGKGLTTIQGYREHGLIKPKGRYWSSRGASFYYDPAEVERLKRELEKSPKGLRRKGMKRTGRMPDDIVMSIYLDPRPQTEVGREYGITNSMVSAIKRGRHYADVTEHKTGAAE